MPPSTNSLLLSSCLWCRDIIAQASPGGPWLSGDDEGYCRNTALAHTPSLIYRQGCDMPHATEGEARACAQKG